MRTREIPRLRCPVAPLGGPRPPGPRLDAHGRHALPQRSLRANFVSVLGGNAVQAAAQWGILIALAKLGTTALVGQFALGLAVTGPVILLANLHLRGAQATDVQGTYAFSDYLGLRCLSTMLALAAIVLLGLGYRREVFWVILAVGISKAVDSLADVIFGLFQQHERMDRSSGSMMLRGPLSLAAFVAALATTGSLVASVLAMAAMSVLVLLAWDLPHAARIVRAGPYSAGGVRPRWRPRAFLRLAATCLPLGLVSVLISLNANIPRYFLDYQWGERELGLFAALSYLIAIGTQVSLAMGQTATPRLARHFALGDRRAFFRLLVRLVAMALGLGAIGVVAAVVWGEWILRTAFTAEYAAYQRALVVLMCAGTLAYAGNLLGCAGTATRRFGQLILPHALLTALVALVSALLVPRYGIDGAAWTAAFAGLGTCVAPAIILASTRFEEPR